MLELYLEMDLGYAKGDRSSKSIDNRRNGYSKKKVKGQFGEIELDIPRDRNAQFEPTVVPKNKRDIYGIEVSAEMVSKMTDSLIPYIKEWQNRPLDKVYAFVFMDAIHYKG